MLEVDLPLFHKIIFIGLEFFNYRQIPFALLYSKTEFFITIILINKYVN